MKPNQRKKKSFSINPKEKHIITITSSKSITRKGKQLNKLTEEPTLKIQQTAPSPKRKRLQLQGSSCESLPTDRRKRKELKLQCSTSFLNQGNQQDSRINSACTQKMKRGRPKLGNAFNLEDAVRFPHSSKRNPPISKTMKSKGDGKHNNKRFSTRLMSESVKDGPSTRSRQKCGFQENRGLCTTITPTTHGTKRSRVLRHNVGQEDDNQRILTSQLQVKNDNDLQTIATRQTDQTAPRTPNKISTIQASRANHNTSQTPVHNSQLCLPYTPECELVFENSPDAYKRRYKRCLKNPGHEGFISVEDFDVDQHLPADFRHEKVKGWIQTLINRTVKVTLKYTSHGRPDTFPQTTKPYPYSEYKGSDRVTRVGSGFITEDLTLVKNEYCPCDTCIQSRASPRDFVRIQVDTAAHVVFDDAEARAVECELFYDTEDRNGVKVVKGVAQFDVFLEEINMDARSNRDYSTILCVSHDITLMEQIPPINRTLQWYHPQLLDNRYGDVYLPVKIPSLVSVIVSHPHGGPKKITTGTTNYLQKALPKFHSPDVKYKIPEGTKFELTISYPSAIESLQTFLESPKPHRAGVEYTLGKDVFVMLPPNANCLCESIRWGLVEFPVGSTFYYGVQDPQVQQEPVVLKHVGFKLLDAGLDWFDDKSWYMVYDTKTCPGSSGGHVTFDQILIPLEYDPLHFGSFPLTDTTAANRSGAFTDINVEEITM